MGSIPQYLTSVFGGAYVIFRVPEGEAWDPVNDENMKTTDLSKPNSNVYYAKIHILMVNHPGFRVRKHLIADNNIGF